MERLLQKSLCFSSSCPRELSIGRDDMLRKFLGDQEKDELTQRERLVSTETSLNDCYRVLYDCWGN